MKNSLRISILTRDNFTCQYCGRRVPKVELHVEHMISRYDGGSDHPSNLVAACTDCNYGKGKRSLIVEELVAWPAGLVVPAPKPAVVIAPILITPASDEVLAQQARLRDRLEFAHFKSVMKELSTEQFGQGTEGDLDYPEDEHPLYGGH